MTTKARGPRAAAGVFLAALTVVLAGCGSGEASSPAATRAEAAPKSGPVTKPSGARMDASSEQQATAEEKGG